jgi:hypothetical protein
MGTNYVREICQTFRDVSEKTSFSDVKEGLLTLTNELEPLAKKLYFKTQKGTEDMKELAAAAEALDEKLAACNTAEEAADVCLPFHEKLEKIIKHVKTMKVRMT